MAADSLLLMAHGSRNPDWNQPLAHLAKSLIRSTGRDDLQLCFLQFGQPDLPSALKAIAESGARTVQLLPLFFSSGGHVQKDIPQQVRQAQQRWDLSVEILPAVGEMPEFADMLGKLIQRLS